MFFTIFTKLSDNDYNQFQNIDITSARNFITIRQSQLPPHPHALVITNLLSTFKDLPIQDFLYKLNDTIYCLLWLTFLSICVHFCAYMFSVLLDICLGVEFLELIWSTDKSLFNMAVLFYIPTGNVRGFQFLSPTLVVVCLFNYSYPSEYVTHFNLYLTDF